MIPPRRDSALSEGRPAWDRRAALWAGVAAGLVATAAQLALWAAFTDAPSSLFLEDSRRAAAILMGPGVLKEPSGWRVMAAATAVHFGLSAVYGLILCRLVSALALLPTLLAGTACGLALYTVNMFGFTAIFPWFAADRDWITALVHGLFGMTIAGFYAALRRSPAPAP